MYITRPLSLYYNSPAAALAQSPDGPNSGILVIEDGEAEAQAMRCWGQCKDSRMYRLPFPQNRMIKVRYRTGTADNRRTYHDDVFFVPVIGQPLSSNRYYVIRAHGGHKGKTCTCSKEEDVSTCCLCTFINDIEPRPFDHRDTYQQVEITCHKTKFRAKSVAADGIPPEFLRRKGWYAYTSIPTHYNLAEAEGLNASLRARLPNLDFPVSAKHSPAVTVGKWYCPYIFVKEGGQLALRDQMKTSMFYEMTLEQFWEQIYSRENYDDEGNAVKVGVSVRRELALLNGNEAVRENTENVDGVIWFKPVNSTRNGLGLSTPIWERMKWEEGRGGWICAVEKVERVERVERFGGQNGWKKFGCYVLVERFALKRMDGSLALTYEFKHTNKIQTKWE